MIKFKNLALFTLLLTLSACYEDVEGCLDLNAANYDLDADLACIDNCCTYPALALGLDHRYAMEPLRFDTFYQDVLGQEFRVSRLRHYWSDFQLLTTDGDSLTPRSEVDLGLVRNPGDTLFTTVNDNLLLLNARQNANQEIGTYRQAVTLSGLRFRLGLNDSLQLAAPNTLVGNHPLAFQDGRLYFGRDTGYVMFSLEYELVQGNDTLARRVDAFGSQLTTLPFGSPTELPPGFDVVIDLELATSLWLEGLDLSQPASELSPILRERLPLVVAISP